MIEFFKKYWINKDDKIIIACSWWSDSIFLVEKIIKIHPKENIIIAHYNHKLRWKESDNDELFVINYCKKNWLKIEVGTWDIQEFSTENKIWIEEWARIKRYEFLEEIRENYKAKYIFTAHHLWDSIETFIFNLIRWTKLNWLTWIEENNWKILRPLLNISKTEILDYCRENNISFVEDSSNKEDIFLRNHIRLNIVSQFSKINPSYEKSFSNIFEYFSEIKKLFDREIEQILKSNSEISWYNWSFEIEKFKSLSPLLQNELIAQIYKKTNNWTIWLSEWNIKEVAKFIFDRWNLTKKEIKKMKLFKKWKNIYFN